MFKDKIFLFYPIIYLTKNFNSTPSLVQKERFTKERKLFQAETDRKRNSSARNAVDKTCGFIYTDHGLVRSCPELDELNKKKTVENLGLIKDIRNMLEYEKVGFFHLFLFIIHLLVLISQIVKSLVFSIFSTETDLIKNEFKHPVPRFFESTLYLTDQIHTIDQCGFLNVTIGLLAVQYTIIRVRNFCRRINLSKINRHEYKKILKSDIDIHAANYLRADFITWIKLLKMATYKCQCDDHKFLLRGKNGKRMKELSRRIRKYDKLDNIYSFNHIEFNTCYKGSGFLFDYDKHNAEMERRIISEELKRKELKTLREKLENSTLWIDRINLFALSLRETLNNWYQRIFTIEEPDHAMFLPEPFYHIQPTHLSWLLYACINSFAFILSNYAIAMVAILKIAFSEPEAVEISGEQDNKEFYKNYLMPLTRYRNFFGLGHTTIVFWVLFSDIQDCALVIQAFMSCHSRTNKVLDMLKREVEFCRFHMRGFNKYMEENGFVLDETRSSPRSSFLCRRENFIQNLRNKEKTLRLGECLTWPNYNHFSGGSSQDINNNNDELSGDLDDNDNLDEEEGVRVTSYNSTTTINKQILDSRRPISYKSAVAQYRARINRHELEEFNDNIEYIIELVNVLQNEFQDLRKFFTFFMNVTVIFGSAAFSISYAFLCKAKTFPQTDLSFFLLCHGLTPMVCSLFVGATSEQSVSITISNNQAHQALSRSNVLIFILTKFRYIYSYMIPLMQNELQLVKMKVVQKLQKEASFLRHTENRSFIILGNIALSYGSFASIMCTIFSINLILQRYLENIVQ